MNEIPLKQVIDASLENLKKVLSVDTVIGEPITLPNQITIIPISKVSVGFTSGGVDFDSKNNPTREQAHFGGGNGAGMSITPLAFLVVSGTDVKILNVNNPNSSTLLGTVSELIERSPEIINKFVKIFKKETEEIEIPESVNEAE